MTKQRRASPGVAFEFLKSLVGHQSDGCILWPFATMTNGYGSVQYEGRTHAANRVMLILERGVPASRRVAAHKCRNRNCVNPRHLRWATTSSNQKDRVRDGTSNRGAACGSSVLTDREVLEIVEKCGNGKSRQMVADEYSVTVWAVHDIMQGRSWSWLTGIGRA